MGRINKDVYNRVIDEAKKSGVFNGKKVRTKMEVRIELAKLLCLSVDSIIGYGRTKSNTNVPDEIVRKMEEIFELNEGDLDETPREEKKDVEKKRRSNLTDFNKNAIFAAYSMMKDYLHSDEVENEDVYCEVLAALDKFKVAIPNELFDKIYTFAEEQLGAIVYNPEETFAKCYTKDIGTFEEDTFTVNNEEGTYKLVTNFIVRLVEIEQALDDFAMAELNPYLI